LERAKISDKARTSQPFGDLIWIKWLRMGKGLIEQAAVGSCLLEEHP
jgi:hypothetical protein